MYIKFKIIKFIIKLIQLNKNFFKIKDLSQIFLCLKIKN